MSPDEKKISVKALSLRGRGVGDIQMMREKGRCPKPEDLRETTGTERAFALRKDQEVLPVLKEDRANS